MKKRLFIFAANWKSQLTFRQTMLLCEQNMAGFADLATSSEIELVLCPSFDATYAVATLFDGTDVAIGAQNCSIYKTGAYTGEVLARSLAEIGCAYCIVGHSERRTYFKEGDLDAALKIERLMEVGIEPIMCIGENKQDYDDKRTLTVLEQQLQPLFERFSHATKQIPTLCIAYEPLWSIGTGIVPQEKELSEIFSWLVQLFREKVPALTTRFLYGGSVNATSAPRIRSIATVDGFLIGGASLDFQNFKNIVSLCC